jgi:hypothetical protein
VAEGYLARARERVDFRYFFDAIKKAVCGTVMRSWRSHAMSSEFSEFSEPIKKADTPF